MRWLVWLVCVACTPRSVVVTRVERVPAPAARCEVAAPPAEHLGRRTELVAALARVDRELDAIDGELIAAEQVAGLTRDEATALATARLVVLADVRLDEPRGEPPLLLRRITEQYYPARIAKLELEREYGPKHQVMIEAERALRELASDFAIQQTAELDYLRDWIARLRQLPGAAKPAQVVAARFAAIHHALAVALPEVRAVPSDVPADVLVAAGELLELRARHRALARDLGPKHPEMVAVNERIADAEAAFRSAAREALADVGPQAPAAVTSGARVARRAELAAQARALRRELDAAR